MKKYSNKNKTILLLAALITLFFVNALSFIFFKNLIYLNYGLILLFVFTAAGLAYENKKALKTRTAAFGFQSFTSIALVFCILSLINFVAYRYPKDFDLTKNKLHTLSDQTEKLVRGLNAPIEAIFFGSVPPQDAHSALLTKYNNLSTNFNFRMADRNKELFLAKKLGIDRINTLVLQYAGKTSTVEDPNEEKLTNALIKLTQSGDQVFCMVTGHGEASIESSEQDGYQKMKQSLENQAYKVEEINIPQVGQIPSHCSVLGVIGPKTAFFAAEAKAIDDFLQNGGRAIFALDINLDGQHSASELHPILSKWHVKLQSAFLVDLMSRFLGLDASIVPVATFNRDHAITKGMQGTKALFPVSFPLIVREKPPAHLKITTLAETTNQSWGETDFAGLKKQQASKDSNDLSGPVAVAIAIEGSITPQEANSNKEGLKQSKIVVFSTSQFANNQFSRFGANLDFFMNATSWLLDNENMISIRGKDPSVGKVELSASVGQFIFFLVVIALPLIVALIGFVVRWKLRRL